MFASGSALGIPSCLASLQTQTAERVVYGDSKGGVVLLCCSQRELPPRDLIHSDSHQDYVHLHREHSDWVTRVRLGSGGAAGSWAAGLSLSQRTARQPELQMHSQIAPALTPPSAHLAVQLQHIAEVGLVSSSLDCTIKTYDLSSEKVVQTCDVHTKGVKDFVYCKWVAGGCSPGTTVQGTAGRRCQNTGACLLRFHYQCHAHPHPTPHSPPRAYSMFASCGLEREVALWAASTGRRIGSLAGHSASVAHIAIDESLNQTFTLATDRVRACC